MSRPVRKADLPPRALQKCPTGIAGLDQITGGGLPKGRPTLVCGGPGCGKTMLAMEFLVRGATVYGEPGLFVSFEEPSAELVTNFASLGYDLDRLGAEQLLLLDHLHLDPQEIEETGGYDLEGLFIRIGHAIDRIGARRVVLDTLETLFTCFANQAILRSELKRLFTFLKGKGVTAVITGEQGERTLTRFGLEEYVADCVLHLTHAVSDQVATRRMRIVKYRGSSHGTNEYPFLMDDKGVSVLPISSLGLDHAVSSERVSSGIPRLDTMLGGKGYFRGSSILVTGTAGTGKSSMASHFADAACRRDERCLYFAFEESRLQIIRNMRSIGLDLGVWADRGLLRFHNSRPSLYGLEMHLAVMHRVIEEFRPAVVVIDPISNLVTGASTSEVKAMLSRLIDTLKRGGITALCTDLTAGGGNLDRTDVGISSLMDAWLLLQVLEGSGERNRGLYILKARGMNHSNQVREFLLTDHGAELKDVYIGAGTVLTGVARASQEAQDRASAVRQSRKVERLRRALAGKEAMVEAQVAGLRASLEAERGELLLALELETGAQSEQAGEALARARGRRADVAAPVQGTRPKAGKAGAK